MRRLSVPVGESLFREFDNKVPHGIKAALIRSLVKIAMCSPSKVLWEIAQHEDKPELFEIRTKE